MWENSTNFL